MTEATLTVHVAPEHDGGAAPDVGDAVAIVLAPLEHEGSPTVSLREVLHIAFDSLLANKLRSLLTMLGVIIGVGAVVALMAIGAGASASIQSQVQSIGTNVLTISPGFGGDRRPGNAAPSQNLTLADAQAIEALHLPLTGIAPQFNGNGQIVAHAADQNAGILGTTPSYAKLNNLTLQAGTFIDDSHANSPVIVLGANVATKLFGGAQPAIGQFVRVNNQSLLVIGVLASKGGGQFGSVDDRAFVPINIAQRELFGARTPDGNAYRVSSIQLAAQNAGDLDAIQSRIAVLLRERHHLKADGSADDFNIQNQAEILSTLTTITGTLTAFLAAIAGISLLVGGIGIMNIMLVSVTERTREIGLRKAVGARAQDILVQFIAEALVISLLGGLLGLALGAAIAEGATLTGQVTAVISLEAVLLSVGFALAVGLFFGIYPAQRAARLNPIDALRYE
jgi:putative ABC transport system permease protein